MKPRTQIILVGALLIALVALSSARRGARPNSAGQSCGACCPFVQINFSLHRHDSWKHFIDLAYWNVELGEDVE